MGSPYAGNPDSFPDDYLIPDDTDPPTAAAVNVGLEAVGDRTAWLKRYGGDPMFPVPDLPTLIAIPAPFNDMTRIVRHFGVYIFESTSTLDVAVPHVLAADDATPGRWVRAGNTSRPRLQFVPPLTFLTSTSGLAPGSAFIPRAKGAPFTPEGVGLINAVGGTSELKYFALVINGAVQLHQGCTAGSPYGLLFPIDKYLFHGATLSQVQAAVAPATGRSALPGTQKFSMGVFRTTPGIGLDSLIASGDFLEDPSPDLATYEAVHSITMTPNQHNLIDLQTYTYFVQFWNEWGTDALADNVLLGFYLTQLNAADALYGPGPGGWT